MKDWHPIVQRNFEYDLILLNLIQNCLNIHQPDMQIYVVTDFLNNQYIWFYFDITPLFEDHNFSYHPFLSSICKNISLFFCFRRPRRGNSLSQKTYKISIQTKGFLCEFLSRKRNPREGDLPFVGDHPLHWLIIPSTLQ